MKKIVSLLLLIPIFLMSCMSVKTDNKAIPDCIATKIKELQDKEVQSPPAEIWEWKTTDKTYYYITSDCCDQYNYLYDTTCNVVCAPDGGFTGKGDGKCPDFNEDEVLKTLIWKDDR